MERQLLPVFLGANESLKRQAELLDAHVTVLHCAGQHIRDTRNTTMHHQGDARISDARTIRLAEHMVWLTRIFVTSVQDLRKH